MAVLFSHIGSIGDNFMYCYRSSKTAENMLFYNLSVNLKPRDVMMLVLHLGIVKVNVDRRREQGVVEDAQSEVEPEVAASDLWKVLTGRGLESTSKIFIRNGE